MQDRWKSLIANHYCDHFNLFR